MTMQGPTRNAAQPYRPADRKAASALLGDPRPFNAPGSHAHLSGEPAVDGLALWLEPPTGAGEAYLGPVIAPDIGLRFYELVLACANDAIARGYLHGYFTVKDPRLEKLLRLTFRINPIASGWQPLTGTATQWEVHVELPDAIEQLRDVLARLGGSTH